MDSRQVKKYLQHSNAITVYRQPCVACPVLCEAYLIRVRGEHHYDV